MDNFSNHYYTFGRCTENIEIIGDGRVARGTAQSKRGEVGTLVSRQPLLTHKTFEFEIMPLPTRFMGTFEVGLTTDEGIPKFTGASTDTDHPPSESLMCCGRYISRYVNGQFVNKTDISGEVDDDITLENGSKIGVTIHRNVGIVINISGKRVEMNLNHETMPPTYRQILTSGHGKVYGVIRMPCSITQVHLTEVHASHPKPAIGQSYGSLDDVIKNMRLAVGFLHSVTEIDEKLCSTLIDVYLLRPYKDHKDEHTRQMFGDHLAEAGIGSVMKKFDERFRSSYEAHEQGSEGENPFISPLRAVRKTCWHYSEVSLKLSRVFGKTRYLVDMFEVLQNYGVDCTEDKDKEFLRYSAFAILYNSANAVENRSIYEECKMKDTISQFLKSENKELVTASFMSLIHMFGEIVEVEASITHLLKMLEQAVEDEDLRRKSENYGQYTVRELVIALGKIAAAKDENKEIITQRGAVNSFCKLLSLENRPVEQEVTINALVELSKLDSCKRIISENKNAMDNLRSLKRNAASEVVLKAAERAVNIIENGVGQMKVNCEYGKLCKRFKEKQLRLKDELFNKGAFKCHCNDCLSGRGDELYRSHGNPRKEYGRPIGWYRFALQLPARAAAFDAREEWHIAFHGTTREAVIPILRAGELLMPGDKTLKGTVVTDDKRDVAAKKHVILSPSIRYAGHDEYAFQSDYVDDETNRSYKAKTVFQVFIEPNSYEVGPASVPGVRDPVFSTQELEWLTDQRGSTILSALLVNLEEK